MFLWAIMEKFLSNRVINIIYIAGFLDLLGVSLTIPFLTKHARNLGATPTLAGILGSVYGALQLFSSPLVGKWSDASSCRHVLLYCLFLSAIGYALLGTFSGLAFLFLARIPTGLFKHSQEISRIYLSDNSSRESHSKVIGTFNAISNIGFVVGPVIGGHLFDLPYGFTIVSMITAFIFLLNYVLILLIVPVAKTPPICQTQSVPTIHPVPGGIVHSLKHCSHLWDIFLAQFCLGLSVLIYRNNFAMLLDYQHQATSQQSGYLMSYSAVVGTVSSLFVGTVARWYNYDDSLMFFHSALAQLFALFGMIFAPSLWFVALLLTLLSVANSVARVSIINVILKRGQNYEKGTLLGFGASILSVARMLSTVVGGLALEYHVSGPCIVGATTASVGVAILYGYSLSKYKTD